MVHRLNRLLSPRSIAIVGASARQGSLAAATYRQLDETRYSGRLFLINPKYQRLFEQPCYASLADLPHTPDLVVFVISGRPLENSFDQALQLKVGGIVMYASNHVGDDGEISLPERLKLKARQAGIPVIGGNSMGFYNYDHNVFISFDTPPANRPGGHIGLVVHSGSAMTYLANNDARFCYNYVISGGQETHGTVADYMDYLLEQQSTKVVALFLESVRDVPGFIDALKKAREKNIPVVITKLGRTEKSAELAVSHSGAIAGNHEAFIALCHRFGAVLANDMDELITTAMLFASCQPLLSDGIASLLDSGGMREQMIDLADDYGLHFANISEQTRSVMRQHLEHGLVADNPLDAMGALGRNTRQTYHACGRALLDDPDTGLLTYEFEFRDGFTHYPEMFEVIDSLAGYNSKPLIVINSFSFASLTDTAAQMSHQGIPVINGIDLAMRSVRNFCRYHLQPKVPVTQPVIDFSQSLSDEWSTRLQGLKICDERTSLQMMTAFNLPVVTYYYADELETLITRADQLTYPVVLKTAEQGISHKSDIAGVKLSIQDVQQLKQVYDDFCRRIGNAVIVMPMARQGIELSLGMKNDPQYGPLLIISAGGILIELINDRAFALAPVSRQQAIELLEQLKVVKLLKGVRGQAPSDIAALVDLIVSFSEMIYIMRDSIAEIDLNPVIAHPQGCTIVDALVVPKQLTQDPPAGINDQKGV